jgi:hypothetical protein
MQQSWKMELKIERYGSGRFQGQNGIFKRLLGGGGICGIFEWLEIVVMNLKGSCEVWKIFREFWWIFGVFRMVRN